MRVLSFSSSGIVAVVVLIKAVLLASSVGVVVVVASTRSDSSWRLVPHTAAFLVRRHYPNRGHSWCDTKSPVHLPVSSESAKRRRRRRTGSRGTMATSSSSSRLALQSSNNDDNAAITTSVQLSEWTSLNPESLVAAPCLLEQTLCQPQEDGQPQLAKDVAYAQAVLEAWKQEEATSDTVWEAEWCQCRYTYTTTNKDGTTTTTPLYGHWIRRPPTSSVSRDDDTSPVSATSTTTPAVIFFHTGAGPHDLFLLYKAAALVNHEFVAQPSSSDAQEQRQDVVVLIADVLSDETGWAWNADDRTRYTQERDNLLGGDRQGLRDRVQAALDVVQSTTSSTSTQECRPLAVLGWCLGGHAVLQVAKLQVPAVRAMATFHGVFDGCRDASASDSSSSVSNSTTQKALELAEVLICHGVEDPFVSASSLEQALTLLQDLGYARTSLLQLSQARHGFTNPAQDWNPHEDFAYQAQAADKAWKQTLNMLQRTLFGQTES